MRRCLLFLILFGFIYQLSARAEVTEVTVSNDYPVVTRVAIALTQQTTWSYTVDTDKHIVNVNIKNCSMKNVPKSGLSNNKMISGLDFKADSTGIKVFVSLNAPFLLETMTVDDPFKIVLDLFSYKKTYTFLENLWMAKFYEDTSQFTKANKQYSGMMKIFPNDTPGYYYWANLLIQLQQKEKAKQKLRLVAQGSKYYTAAQNLLAKLENRTPPPVVKVQPVKPTPPPVKPKPEAKPEVKPKPEPKPEPIPAAVETAPAESLPPAPPEPAVKPTPIFNRPTETSFKFLSFRTFFGMSFHEFTQTKFIRGMLHMPFWFWLIFVVVIVVAVLIFIDAKTHHRRKAKAPVKQDTKQTINDAVKQGMVIKLMENGWTEQEIARELLLNSKDAHMYVSQGKKIIKRKTTPSE